MPLVVVTGGAGPMGAGVAECLLAKGWEVVLVEGAAGLQSARDLAARLGDKVSVEEGEVARPDSVDAAFRRIASRRGGFQALVNCAEASSVKAPFVSTAPDDWRRLIETDLNGVFNCCQAAVPHLAKAGKGAIVSIATGAGLKGVKEAAIYSTAKAGVIVFTQAMAQELGPQNIRINSVDAGGADARNLLPNKTTPQDVGKAVAFLLSDRAAHITGALMDLSGGSTMH
jgi:NAD(P)-dependent dehydrogenase (short-subunit alcohol dehydrogenase family)